MNNPSQSYFRIKTECALEDSNGVLSKKKIEELVLATSYTEAEALAYKLTEDFSRNQFGEVNYEIIKTKISTVLYNEVFASENSANGFTCNYFSEEDTTETGLYSVKVMFLTVDERSGKEKWTPEILYVPATSNADATERISKHFKGASDYVIRDAKFDKAEAIYWPADIQKSKVESYALN